jgi:hypothetical protein
MLHSLLHKNKVIGLFSDHKKCEIMIDGLVKNNFAQKSSLSIKSFYINSITSAEYKEEDSSDSELYIDKLPKSNFNLKIEKKNDKLQEDSDNETTDSDVPNEEDVKKRSEIQNNIHLLKKQKEKLEESKRVYDVDLELYNKFKKIKETNTNFEIPEMFINKYELMDALDKEKKLCWENFNDLYKPKPIPTSFDKLFNDTQGY